MGVRPPLGGHVLQRASVDDGLKPYVSAQRGSNKHQSSSPQLAGGARKRATRFLCVRNVMRGAHPVGRTGSDMQRHGTAVSMGATRVGGVLGGKFCVGSCAPAGTRIAPVRFATPPCSHLVCGRTGGCGEGRQRQTGNGKSHVAGWARTVRAVGGVLGIQLPDPDCDRSAAVRRAS